MPEIGGPEILILLAILAFVVAIPVTICAILFTVYRRVPERHRQLAPGLVWLILIPCFGWIWNFFVYLSLSRSLASAYRAAGRKDVGDCGYGVGLAYCICVAASIVPYAGCLTLPAALVLLIIYFVKVLGLSRDIPPPVEGSDLPAAPIAPAMTPAVIAVVVVAGVLAYIAVIGIIAAIAIPNLLNAVDRGKQKRTMADLSSIGAAIESYRVDEGKLPIATDAATLEGMLAPTYITSVPKLDGWGHTIAIDVREGGYVLSSTGKDGIVEGCSPGTTDDFDADICFVDGQLVRYPEGIQRQGED